MGKHIQYSVSYQMLVFLGILISEKLGGLFLVTLVRELRWWGNGLHVKR